MNKEKLIGAIIVVIITILGALGVVKSDALKQSICEQPASISK